MYRNKFGERLRPLYADLNGNEIKRTPVNHPYNYDEYVTWKAEDFDEDRYSAVYSDRLFQWDYEKYNKCCEEVFGNHGQYFSERNPEEIERFLCLYFGKLLKLTAIMQGCNQSSGYPYWVFLYEERTLTQ